jgi:hypothetical protein
MSKSKEQERLERALANLPHGVDPSAPVLIDEDEPSSQCTDESATTTPEPEVHTQRLTTITISSSNAPDRTEAFKKHHLLSPREVDLKCDEQHNPGGLVAGFLRHRSLSILVGDSGLGKSPLAYQLGLCVAQGIPFLGLETEPGIVVYADYENGLQEAKELRNGLCQFLNLSEPPANFRLWSPEAADSLDVEAVCADTEPSLFIIDSLRAHNPLFESKDNAGKEMASLRSAAYKNRVAILLVHHIRKPGQEGGVPDLEDDSAGVMLWLNQAAGHRSIVNQSDTRIATDASRRVPDAAMVLRWHRRIHGEGGIVYLERITNDEGVPIGYQRLVGARLLGNSEQEAAFGRLPEKFHFKEAKAIYGRTDDPTRKWLLKCVASGLLTQVSKGLYERLPAPPRS